MNNNHSHYNFSHVFTVIYWATLQKKTNVLGITTKNFHLSNLKSILPYIPTLLPTLLYCRHTQLKMTLYRLNTLEVDKQEISRSLLDEKLIVRNTANDIKIIG